MLKIFGEEARTFKNCDYGSVTFFYYAILWKFKYGIGIMIAGDEYGFY